MSSAPASPLRILIIDDEPNIRKTLAVSLSLDGHTVVTASRADEALNEVRRQSFDTAFVDLRLGTDTGLDLLPRLAAESPWTKLVVMTAYASVETAVEAMKRGAADYLPKPFTPAQIRLVLERIQRLRELEQRVATLQGDAEPEIDLSSNSPAMRRALSLAQEVAASEASVLIRGESGTGKGVLARAIHGWSERGAKPMAVVSCPTISPQLLESELFGHVKGAFTGALRDNPGRIAAVQGGTLFLDEIGDLPTHLQPKLLRFVQDREYERVGDPTTRRADVRVLSATNIDLSEAVRAGRFREDLLYRINVIQIDLPALRQRTEDLMPLASRLLTFFSRRRPIDGFTPAAEDAMRAYGWPGNVRELRNVIERAAILCHGEKVGVEHLPANLSPAVATSEPALGDPVPFEQIEAIHIRRLLARTRSIDEAAAALGIDAATLWRKRKKFGI
jgi:NtrC-family two-component system response regulator AlgB